MTANFFAHGCDPAHDRRSWEYATRSSGCVHQAYVTRMAQEAGFTLQAIGENCRMTLKFVKP